jgi:ribosomal protein S18 acetylase RimI-like enzyme
MNLIIRKASDNDIDTIVTFNYLIAKETEAKLLDKNIVKLGVNSVITDPSKAQYWVVESNNEIIGLLMVTYEWSDWRNGDMWWISSVYVTENFRRRGVFSALYKHIEHMAKENPGCCGIRLYIEKHNERAQKTYLSLGMNDAGYDVMEVDFTKH